MEGELNPSVESRCMNGEKPGRRRIDVIVVTREKKLYVIWDVEVMSQAGQHTRVTYRWGNAIKRLREVSFYHTPSGTRLCLVPLFTAPIPVTRARLRASLSSLIGDLDR